MRILKVDKKDGVYIVYTEKIEHPCRPVIYTKHGDDKWYDHNDKQINGLTESILNNAIRHLE